MPLLSVGSPPTIAGLVWQDASGGNPPAFYVDDVVLVGAQQPGAYAPLAVNENASVDGYQSNQFTWYDSGGKPRTTARWSRTTDATRSTVLVATCASIPIAWERLPES